MADVDPMQFLRQPPGVASMEQSKTFDAKKWVWVPDGKEGFVAAAVEKADGDNVTLKTSDGKVSSLL